MEDIKNILILGAGFAGIYIAVHLSKKLSNQNGISIRLIDAKEYHLFKPMLHEVACGSVDAPHIIQPIRIVNRKHNFDFMHGVVQSIDVDKQIVGICEECVLCFQRPKCLMEELGLDNTVFSEEQKHMHYDYLVLALGGEPNYFGIDGAEEYTIPLHTLDDAVRIRERLGDIFRISLKVSDEKIRRTLLTFAVIGAGATGVELVSEMHDFIYEILLAHGGAQIRRDEVKIFLIEAANRILPGVDEKVVKTIEEKLGQKNIEVITGAPVTKVNRDSLEIGDRQIPTYTKIWTAGIKANPLSASLPFEKDRVGRIKVNQYMQVPDYPNVYAVGDNSSFENPATGASLPATGQVAIQEAQAVVENIFNTIKGKEKRAFKFKQLGFAVTYGERTAAATILGALKLEGLFGWLMWKLTYFEHLISIRPSFKSALEWLFDITYDRDASRHKYE
ncbi:MAG: NAD(P)/FAD-dependent oxidoreductase [Candidatus Poribacteria bacterium]